MGRVVDPELEEAIRVVIRIGESLERDIREVPGVPAIDKGLPGKLHED